MALHEEVVLTLEQLRRELEELAVRGLRAVMPRQVERLGLLREELEGIGAEHLAGTLGELQQAIRADDPAAAKALLRAQIALRVFERMVTLEVAQAQLQQLAEALAPADAQPGGDE
jgi:hypothetical protein